jgi:glycosyltransferase involved in cell wall biosynthesis
MHSHRNGNGNDRRKVLMIIDEAAIQVGDKTYCGGTETLFWCSHFKSFDRTFLSIPRKEEEGWNPEYPHILNTPENTAISPRKFYQYQIDALRNPVNFFYNYYILVRDILRSDAVIYRLPNIYLPLLLPVLILFRKRKKVVLLVVSDFYGRTFENSWRPRQILRNLIARVYDFCERTGSRYFKTLTTGRYLAEKYSADVFDISLIPSQKIRHTTNDMKDGKIKLLYVGKLDRAKSVDTILSAIDLLDEHYKNRIRLRIVGTGYEENYLKESARTKGIDRLVSFEGPVPFGPDLDRYYRESNIFILSSIYEGTPKVLFEAMANRLAIIATSVGGVPSATENGKSAYLVPPGSPESIRDAIVKVISDEKLRSDLIENGTRIVSENTTEKKIAYIEGLLAQ